MSKSNIFDVHKSAYDQSTDILTATVFLAYCALTNECRGFTDAMESFEIAIDFTCHTAQIADLQSENDCEPQYPSEILCAFAKAFAKASAYHDPEVSPADVVIPSFSIA